MADRSKELLDIISNRAAKQPDAHSPLTDQSIRCASNSIQFVNVNIYGSNTSPAEIAAALEKVRQLQATRTSSARKSVNKC